ncbi:MAG: HAD family phosphatase [Treponema sp.]|nr:HAD family phosphatase [Treponema sp.]
MSIKGVVFDYGRVISCDPPKDTMAKMAAIAGISAETLESLVWTNRAEFDRGTIRGMEYYRNLLASAEVELDDASLQKMLEIDLESWTTVNPGTVKLMEDLKAAGIKVAVLSNMPHDFLDTKADKLDVFNLPEVLVFSCHTGWIKPEKEIYNIVIEQCSLKAEELVFFDDIQKNIDGALAAGIHGFLWTNVEQGRRDLANLGLLL